MSEICLICGKPCLKEEQRYHPSCSRKMFGMTKPPKIPFDTKDLKKLAGRIIRQKTAMTGVQKKLSLTIQKESHENKLTFVGLWGDYILKPQVEQYEQLPENEFLTMCLADSLGIQTVPHALLPMASGEIAYVTKRIDRMKNKKIHMEDMAQLLEKMTEDKYRGSVEQIGKIILKNCENRLLDALRFYELVLFSYLTGNSDMHLKNYSLIYTESGTTLAPAYDLLNTRLVIPEKNDPDESALSINGKRRKLKLGDFIALGDSLTLTEKQIMNIHKRFEKRREATQQIIQDSLLKDSSRQKYLELFEKRFQLFI